MAEAEEYIVSELRRHIQLLEMQKAKYRSLVSFIQGDMVDIEVKFDKSDITKVIAVHTKDRIPKDFNGATYREWAIGDTGFSKLIRQGIVIKESDGWSNG